MILMARHMRLSIVAEGVEAQLQADYLRDGGVDLLQGFHFHKPARSPTGCKPSITGRASASDLRANALTAMVEPE